MNDEPSTPKRVRQGMDYGETEEVQETHAAIQREKREPRAGLEPLSLWLIALYGLAVFFGGASLEDSSKFKASVATCPLIRRFS